MKPREREENTPEPRTLAAVGAAPQVPDDLVDLRHLHAVELHDGSGGGRRAEGETLSGTKAHDVAG